MVDGRFANADLIPGVVCPASCNNIAISDLATWRDAACEGCLTMLVFNQDNVSEVRGQLLRMVPIVNVEREDSTELRGPDRVI